MEKMTLQLASLIIGPGHLFHRPSTPPQHPKTAKMCLDRLPCEIVDLIAINILDQKDLLSLASTCSALWSVIAPNHLHWSELQCRLNQPKLWKYLSGHSSLAQNVRSLTLDSCSPERIPQDMEDVSPFVSPSLSEQQEEENERDLIEAISKMTNINRLVYRISPPFHCNLFWDQLWKSCSTLTDLEVADGFRMVSTIPSFRTRSPIHGSSLFKCKRLKRFVWYFSYEPTDTASILHELQDLEDSLVNYCPDLEELRISYARRLQNFALYAGSLLARAHWPRLRVLELTRFHAGDEEAVAEFFSRHPQLQALYLDQVDATSGRYVYMDNLSNDALPNLDSFWGGIDNVISILSCGSRPIQRVGGIQFDTILLGARRPASWTSTAQGQKLLDSLTKAKHLEEVQGEFALSISDKLDLSRLFSACRKVKRLGLHCTVTGFIESFLPAFACLEAIESLLFPIQQFDILQRPLTQGSMSLRYLGTSDTFVASLKHKAMLVASVCPTLEEIHFGNQGGTAKVIRYPGSTEVSDIVLAESTLPRGYWMDCHDPVSKTRQVV